MEFLLEKNSKFIINNTPYVKNLWNQVYQIFLLIEGFKQQQKHASICFD
jgi:hypothetical protein